MKISYEIKQKVSTIEKAWQETIYKTQSERMAWLSFKNLSEEYPNEYFELLKITHNEKCLGFTKTDNQSLNSDAEG